MSFEEIISQVPTLQESILLVEHLHFLFFFYHQHKNNVRRKMLR